MKRLRTIIQVAVIAAAVLVTVRHFMGASQTTIESYCPMGGLATFWSFVTEGQFTCVTGAVNLALFGALVLSAVLARKAFCGWVCPIGTLSEWARSLSLRLFGLRDDGRLRFEPPAAADRGLRWLRLPVLAAVLVGTAWAAELVFRGYCPYYVLFGLSDHGVAGWQYGLMAVIVVSVFLVPMAWCRYLCPLGGALWPFSRVGSLRITRNRESCTDCRTCSLACPQAIEIADAPEVRSGECTLCLDCLSACPAPGTLGLAACPVPRNDYRWTASGWQVPAILVVATVLGMSVAGALEVPSFEREYRPMADSARLVTFEIQGLKCRGTARSLADRFEDAEGVIRFVGYASDHRAEVTIDPNRTDVDTLVRMIEGLGYDEERAEYRYGLFRVLSVDGNREVNP